MNVKTWDVKGSYTNQHCCVPLIEKAFNYCLLTHPVGAMFGGVELDKVYSQLIVKLGLEKLL